MTQPANSLAILYADICDSMRLYGRLGDREALRLVEGSMQAMVEITQRFGGTLIRTQGDGVMSTLPSAAAACEAAQAMQREHEQGQVAIKVGFNYGAVISSGGDVYGDAVNIAARVSALARSGEILTTEETVVHLAPEQRLGARLLDQTTVKGKSEPLRIYSLVNEKDGQTTLMLTRDNQHTASSTLATLVLEHGERRIQLQSLAPPLTMGRGSECQLQVNDDLVSRRHAVIEPKRDHFVITDLSTNGTYLITGNGERIFLKRESARMVGSGGIWLGRRPDEDGSGMIRYFSS